MQARIHITGASGSGTTTLGRAVAQHVALPHFDTDDFYWLPMEPVYSEKRVPEDRIRLMQELFAPRRAWVLSGSLMGWGDSLRPLFDMVVFLRTPMEERLARLRQREAVRFGTDAIGPNGERHDDHMAFMDWAGQYDNPEFEGRSRRRHEAWLADLHCPILRLDGTQRVDELVTVICRQLTA